MREGCDLGVILGGVALPAVGPAKCPTISVDREAPRISPHFRATTAASQDRSAVVDSS